jgi:hypothetical protein
MPGEDGRILGFSDDKRGKKVTAQSHCGQVLEIDRGEKHRGVDHLRRCHGSARYPDRTAGLDIGAGIDRQGGSLSQDCGDRFRHR